MIKVYLDMIFLGLANSIFFDAGNERLIIIWNNGKKSNITGSEASVVNKFYRKFTGDK